MKIIWVIALLVAVCVSSSSSLHCYSCTYPPDSNCQDVKDLSGVDCGEPTDSEKALGIKAVCLKLVITDGGIKQVARACSLQVGQTNACALLAGNVDHCSLCETDLCNKSTYVLASIWSVALPVVAIMLMKLL